MSMIGKDMYIETGTVDFASSSSETDLISLDPEIPVTFQPVITAQVISLKENESSTEYYGVHLQNVNSFLTTSTPTHNGTRWQFKIRRSVGGGSVDSRFTKVAWKAVALKHPEQIGTPVTPVTEA